MIDDVYGVLNNVVEKVVQLDYPDTETSVDSGGVSNGDRKTKKAESLSTNNSNDAVSTDSAAIRGMKKSTGAFCFNTAKNDCADFRLPQDVEDFHGTVLNLRKRRLSEVETGVTGYGIVGDSVDESGEVGEGEDDAMAVDGCDEHNDNKATVVDSGTEAQVREKMDCGDKSVAHDGKPKTEGKSAHGDTAETNGEGMTFVIVQFSL